MGLMSYTSISRVKWKKKDWGLLKTRLLLLLTKLLTLQLFKVDCPAGKKAIVIFVPVPQLKAFQKIQAR